MNTDVQTVLILPGCQQMCSWKCNSEGHASHAFTQRDSMIDVCWGFSLLINPWPCLSLVHLIITLSMLLLYKFPLSTYCSDEHSVISSLHTVYFLVLKCCWIYKCIKFFWGLLFRQNINKKRLCQIRSTKACSFVFVFVFLMSYHSFYLAEHKKVQ